MRIALVHELLTMKGGAETVLKIFADMFPTAPIYTLLYNEAALGDWFPPSRVRTANLPSSIFHRSSRTRFNHHLYLKQFPRAVEHWNFDDFDVVLSSSSAFTHGIITNGKPRHISYIHSPARYLWDRTHDVQARAGQGLFGSLQRRYLAKTLHDLRIWDSEAADRADVLLAASQTVQRRIELYWRRESTVVYPPIDDVWLSTPPTTSKLQPTTYLLVSSLANYKRLDLAIEACNILKRPLKIAGTGPAYRTLRKIAGPTIEFLGYVPREQLRDLYSSAHATIFPGDEDFGLVPIESMACGTPVIAYRSGGALETLHEDSTAVFFDEATPASLVQAMGVCEQKTFNPEICIQRALLFGRERFEGEIRTHVEKNPTTKSANREENSKL